MILKLIIDTQTFCVALIITTFMTSLILISTSQVNRPVEGTPFNSSNIITNNNDDIETEICTDPENETTCTTGPSDNPHHGFLPLVACYEKSCKALNSTRIAINNSENKDTNVLIGISLKYSNDTLQYIQKNKAQLKSYFSSYIDKALDNLVSGKIQMLTECPKSPPIPGILCDGMVIWKDLGN
jgi:hypothetical protein